MQLDLNEVAPDAPQAMQLDLNQPAPGSLGPVLPDLNEVAPEWPQPMQLDLNEPAPDSPRPVLPDLNEVAPDAPQAMQLDLNEPAPDSPGPVLPDLNELAPDMPQRIWLGLNESAPGSPRPVLPDLNLITAGAGEQLIPQAVLADLGIHGEPVPAHVLTLVDHIAQNPDLAVSLYRTASEMLETVDLSPELREGLASRRGPQAHPLTHRAVSMLLNLITTFDAYNSELDEEGLSQGGLLEADLAMQTVPLSHELAAWLHGTRTAIGRMDAFDEEPNARPFARLLARLREPREGGSSRAAERMATEVSSVIVAIASDATLRAEVFSIAETALGTCNDNVAEGFSNVLLAVRNHDMAQAVARRDIDEAQLLRWVGQQFHLSLVEDAVNRFIRQQLARDDLPADQRECLTNEPVETMIHAKTVLRRIFDLPPGTVSDMTFRNMSVLQMRDLQALADEVRAQASDPAAILAYLLGNTTWRAGLQALHPDVFEMLASARDEDPFFDLDLPQDLEEQVRYAEMARAVEAKWKLLEDEWLMHLGTPPDLRGDPPFVPRGNPEDPSEPSSPA